MNLLLDTHILLWAAAYPTLPRPEADRLVKDADNQLWFSAASIWEVAIKSALGRPDFRVDAGALRAGLVSNGYAELAIDGRHAARVATLPDHHRDPFDRMLVAQAVAEGLVLVTADAEVARYDTSIRLI